MTYNAQFDQPQDYKLILQDSYQDNIYYGLDQFDCKYLRIVQAKFGCLNSYHTIPDRVKMEMAPYVWNLKKQKFILDVDKRVVIQLNQLENAIISHSFAKELSSYF